MRWGKGWKTDIFGVHRKIRYWNGVHEKSV